MGAWGYKPFQNDTAMDWFDGNLREKIISAVSCDIEAEDIYCYEAAIAIAAANIMVALHNNCNLFRKDELEIARNKIHLLKLKGYHKGTWKDKKKAAAAINNLLHSLEKACD